MTRVMQISSWCELIFELKLTDIYFMSFQNCTLVFEYGYSPLSVAIVFLVVDGWYAWYFHHWCPHCLRGRRSTQKISGGDPQCERHKSASDKSLGGHIQVKSYGMITLLFLILNLIKISCSNLFFLLFNH